MSERRTRGRESLPRVREAIVVEGRYDKNALAQIVNAPVITLEGFSIFHNREKLLYLRRLAEERGLIVLTDSDGAGFVLRRYLKGALPPERVKHAYIPEIAGKECRKRTPGKSGLLGVEGMRPALLLDALRRAGATFSNLPEEAEARRPDTEQRRNADTAADTETNAAACTETEADTEGTAAAAQRSPITRTDFYLRGLSGGADSRARRRSLCKRLSLPESLNANALLEALNLLYSREELDTILEELEPMPERDAPGTRTGGIPE